MNRRGLHLNREKPLRDQAERLRKRIAKKEEEWTEVEEGGALPPRSRVHQQKQKRKKTKLKLKYPLIRFLALFFILIPILSLSIFMINENKKSSHVEPVVNEQDNYETVELGEDEKEVEPEPIDEPKQDGEEAENDEVDPPSNPSNESVGTTPNEKSTEDEDEPVIKEEEQTTTEEKVIYHTVNSKDNLYRIALKYYQSTEGIEIIKKANNLQGDNILAGQKLKIPLN